MRTAHDFTEAAVLERALDHDCQDCGAKAGVRCRILSPNQTAPGKTKVDVKRKPCSARVTVAWRQMLNAR
jgi:hypothetical protein